MTKSDKPNQSGFSLVELLIVSVILVIVIGILSTIVTNVQSSLAQQRPRTEALNEATAAMDSMIRLIRMAGNNPTLIANLQPIDPGSPVGGLYPTIRIRSDWRGNGAMNSTPDGDTADPMENVLFSVANNTLMKQETPADTVAVPFLDNVGAMTFTYFDTNDAQLLTPHTQIALISRIEINLTMQAGDTPPMTFTASAFVRQR